MLIPNKISLPPLEFWRGISPRLGRGVAPTFKSLPIAYHTGKHAGDNRTIARLCLQAADVRILAAVCFDLARVVVDVLFEFNKLFIAPRRSEKQ